MTPIETTWRGWRFRSRTEARWAVLLHAASIPFEYEPEGFALPSGWYLPDFWLPDRGFWLEVKGFAPNSDELRKAEELTAATGRDVLFAIGQPNPDGPDELMMGNGFVMQLRAPRSAYLAARAERFDGKPSAPVAEKRRRWW
jgi:hypothetical protein